MDEITVVTPSELAEPEGPEGVSRQVVFETHDTILVRSRVDGGVTTGWHHNGDRHVYGFVVNGHAVLEYGPGGGESVDLDKGKYVYVPPRTVRRVVNPNEEGWEILISFVGTGPPAVAVDAPSPRD